MLSLKALKVTTAKMTPPRQAFEALLRFRRMPKPQKEQLVLTRFDEILEKNQLRPWSVSYGHRLVIADKMVITREKAALPMNGSIPLAAEMIPQSLPVALPLNLSFREKMILESAGIQAGDLEESQSVENLLALQKQRANVSPALRTISSEAPTRPFKNSNKDFKISGALQLDSMTALLPGHSIEVHWMREGVNQVSGRILSDSGWGPQGFEIQVPELVGLVQAEMYNSGGRVVAKGALRLSPQMDTAGLEKMKIELRPVDRYVASFTDFSNDPASIFSRSSHIRGASAPGSKSKKGPGSEAQLIMALDDSTQFQSDASGYMAIEGISDGSETYAFAQRSGYYPSVHLLTAGVGREALPLIQEKTAKTLLSIIQDLNLKSPLEKPDSLVIGQARFNGSPAAGVRVESELNEDLQPIYLNEVFIPDPHLTQTASHGLFVLAQLPSGYYSFKGTKSTNTSGYGNVLVENASASFFTVDLTDKNSPFELRSYDYLTGQALSVKVHSQLGSVQFDSNGYARVDLPVAEKPFLLDTTSSNEDYLPLQYILSANSDHALLPQLKSSWIEGMAETAKVTPNPELGTIVGFLNHGNYEIDLPHFMSETAKLSGTQIVFFGPQGQIVEKPVDQGGFVIFNLPPSAQTLVVKQDLGLVSSRIAPVDSGRVTVLRFDSP